MGQHRAASREHCPLTPTFDRHDEISKVRARLVGTLGAGPRPGMPGRGIRPVGVLRELGPAGEEVPMGSVRVDGELQHPDAGFAVPVEWLGAPAATGAEARRRRISQP